MKSNKLLGLLIGVPLVLVIAGVIITGIIFFTDSGSKRRSGTATAEITNAVPVSWVQSRRTKHGYSVSYRFKTADGRTIEANDPQNTLFEPGTKNLRVCYDPKNPSDSDLRHPTRGTDCGKGLLF
jgi:hypothetical protein